MNIPKNQPHGSIMPIKFSSCATNPCVAAEPWTRPDQVVHHDQTEPRAHPSRAKRISEPSLTNCRVVRPSKPSSRTVGPCICPSTRPCTQLCIRPSTRRSCRRSTRALGRAYARHEHSAAQSCPSHLGPSVLHTLIYEDYVLLLLI